METLFVLDPILPAGFQYTENFISEAEEEGLLKAVRRVEVHPMLFHGHQAKRKVQSFGFDYSFDQRQLKQGKPIPETFDSLIAKIANYVSLKVEDFTELLLTEYPPGSVINWHRDAPPFDIIVGISLLSDCLFRLRPYGKALQGRKFVLSLPVKRRSLYVIQGEARDRWEHSISPVSETRYSITLRTLR